MRAQGGSSMTSEGGLSHVFESIRRAFAEFLTIPTGIIVGFLLLAAGSYALDRGEVAALVPVHGFLKSHVFADAQATGDLLGAIAAGIITVTSITISLLLLAVQQAAAAMTAQVFDQYLRRRSNQIYFGFFVGLALYSLITLATVNDPFNPVFGGTLAVLLTIIALYLLILLLYTTINQMRPVEIIEAIHDHILIARERQLRFINKTRQSSLYEGSVSVPVSAEKHGYVTRIDLDTIDAARRKVQSDFEIVLRVSVGSFVGLGDEIAEVKAQTQAHSEAIGKCVQDAVQLERQRDIALDPAYGIEQLEMIAWTSISTAKSNPSPGLLTIRSLRDVMARWSNDGNELSREPSFPVVYTDNTFAQLMDAFETFAVVSSESMQHQNFIEVVETFRVMFDRLSPAQQQRAEDLILRSLSALGDHVLTAELDAKLSGLTRTLQASGRAEVAAAVAAAQAQLSHSIGRLNSRATRVAAAE